MKSLIKAFAGMLIVALLATSCNKMDPSAIEGNWFGYAQSWSIEFTGHRFSGTSQGIKYYGSYQITRKKLILTFDEGTSSGLDTFRSHMEKINKYNAGNSTLYLYGVNFEIYLTRR